MSSEAFPKNPEEAFAYADKYARLAGDYRKIVEIINNRADWQIKRNLLSVTIEQDIKQGIAIAEAMQNWHSYAHLRNIMGLFYLRRYQRSGGTDDFREADEQFKIAVQILEEHGAIGEEGSGMVKKDIEEVSGNTMTYNGKLTRVPSV